eukprot:781996-Pleurochrysis_carterae.AAC.1
MVSSASQAQPQQIDYPRVPSYVRPWTNRSQSVRRINLSSLTLWASSTRLASTTIRSWSSNCAFWRFIGQIVHGLDSWRRSVLFADAPRLPQRPLPQCRQV